MTKRRSSRLTRSVPATANAGGRAQTRRPARACFTSRGNLDCRELIAGSTLFLPIGVDGGLLSVGDGHGPPGDGEVAGTAIECPMDRVDLTIGLRDDFPIEGPVALTPAVQRGREPADHPDGQPGGGRARGPGAGRDPLAALIGAERL